MLSHWLLSCFAIVVTFTSSPTPSQAALHIEKATQSHIAMAECALFVTRRYISTQTNTLIIQEKCEYCEHRVQNFNCRLLDHYLLHFGSLMTLQLYFGKSDEQPWNYHIFIVNSMAGFSADDGSRGFKSSTLSIHIPRTTYEREYYFLVLLTQEQDDPEARYYTMMQIFESCAAMHVMNVVIMQQEPEHDNSIGFYTYALAGRKLAQCGDYIAINEVNRYRNGVLERDYLFPPPLTNFHGCTINVSAHVLYPLLTFDGNRTDPLHQRDIERLGGIDGDLLRILAKTLNFSVFITFPLGRSDINGFRNQSTGCFAELEQNISEIAIGGFSGSYPDRRKFSASVTYHQSPFVFVLRTGLHFGPIKQLVSPFCHYVWIAIGLTIAVASITIKFVREYTDVRIRNFVLGPCNYSPHTNMLTILLGNPITRPPRRNFARFLLMSWLLATLVLRNAYQGKMFDSLRVSRRISTPNSIIGLIGQRYKLLSSQYVDYYPNNMTVIMDNMTRRYEAIEQAHFERYVTISLVDTLAHYNFQHWNSSNLTIVDEPIFMLQLVMYYRKHSMLRLIFDEKIQQLISSGITSYVSTQRDKRHFRLLNAGLCRLPRISNDMLRGLYSLYMILMGVATWYFIIELLSRRFTILRRFCDWVHCRCDMQQKKLGRRKLATPTVGTDCH